MISPLELPSVVVPSVWLMRIPGTPNHVPISCLENWRVLSNCMSSGDRLLLVLHVCLKNEQQPAGSARGDVAEILLHGYPLFFVQHVIDHQHAGRLSTL